MVPRITGTGEDQRQGGEGGRAKNAERARRNGPRRASVESVARPTQPIARAANDPTGSRLIARMMPTVRTNFRRGSTRWTRLSRAR
jgi:hypothetical protein